MSILLIRLLESLIGFSAGLAVGAGYVAFITILGIVPRLIQLSKTETFLPIYTACILLGSLFGTYLSFTSITWGNSVIVIAIWGLLQGVFNGMLAAALAEVLNVFPILYKRIGIEKYLLWLLMAIVFGKIAGSLFQWLYFVKQ
ncbi:MULTISPECIES: stage V sporulation protein AB [Clostridia]|uniref:stage V sporulation protein AB n=1 Tax=Clostridia TaxID=186801 RepID=UPI000EA02F9F|nr:MULTISPECIES: stage V sporulation protein AB [Clostridia]NBJ71582.1 stage V sporulation protein AB [Roseburia sp. 1XD42-34]RKI74154.1 stage V sporulation protein AB [Clostridium sp. 1xD42-85]